MRIPRRKPVLQTPYAAGLNRKYTIFLSIGGILVVLTGEPVGSYYIV
jgi:hypothetical protein